VEKVQQSRSRKGKSAGVFSQCSVRLPAAEKVIDF
jgi:hypothetical protein